MARCSFVLSFSRWGFEAFFSFILILHITFKCKNMFPPVIHVRGAASARADCHLLALIRG